MFLILIGILEFIIIKLNFLLYPNVLDQLYLTNA